MPHYGNDDQMQMKKKPMEMGQEMTGLGQTVIPLKEYPNLMSAKVGAKVSGTWKGTVESLDDEEITITYDSVDVTSENKADKAMNKMMGRRTVEDEIMEDEEV